MKRFFLIFTASFFVFQSCESLKQSEVRSDLLAGKMYYRTGQYDKSIEELDCLLKLQPDNEKALSLRSKCYISLNKYELAYEDVLKLCSINPSAENVLTKADVEYKMGRFDSAIATCEGLLTTDDLQEDEQLKCWDMLAVCYSDSNRNDMAVQYYNLMLDKTEHPQLYIERGISYYELADYKNASSDFSSALNLSKSFNDPYVQNFFDDDFFYYYAVCLYNSGDYSGALENLKNIKEPNEKVQKTILELETLVDNKN